MIFIGVSLGASNVLQVILRPLRATLNEALAIVVHRHRESDHRLVEILQRSCPLQIEEAADKQPIEVGKVYLAPPDYHLQVQSGHFELSVDDMVNFARPSIDVLFESAADDLGPEAIGVLLTGASSDGARGLAAIKAAGGITIVQDPAHAECPIMPSAALALFRPNHVCRAEEIPKLLTSLALSRSARSADG